MKKENIKTESRKTRKKGVVIATSIGVGICLTAGIMIIAAPDKTSSLINGVISKISTHAHLSDALKKNHLQSVQKPAISKTVEKSVLKSDPINEVISKRAYSPYKAPFSVKGGPVRLRHGYHPSPEKIALGKEMGMDFEELGITWREGCMKGVA